LASCASYLVASRLCTCACTSATLLCTNACRKTRVIQNYPLISIAWPIEFS
jgi:hypothetical protein